MISIAVAISMLFVAASNTNHQQSLLTCSMTESSSACCPPGSWDGPMDLSDPSPPKGSSFLLEGTDLRVYYTAPAAATSTTSSNNSRSNNNIPAAGVVVFHDVWGHLPRLLRFCDTFAAEGNNFHVIAPDCFRGKTKSDVDAVGGSMVEWLRSHPYDEMIAKDIDACLEFLKTKGVDQGRIGAVGFCWGGWAIARSAGSGVPWKVGVSPHPSTSIEQRVFGRDEGDMLSKVNMPFLLLPAGNDPVGLKPGHPWVKKLEEKGGKSIVFEDMVHGWTTRSDLTDPTIKKQVEKALSYSLDFLRQHLQS